MGYIKKSENKQDNANLDDFRILLFKEKKVTTLIVTAPKPAIKNQFKILKKEKKQDK